MIKKTIFLLFIFLGCAAIAQIPKDEISIETGVFPSEQIQLSVNSNLLLAGESLQYKAFVLDAANRKSKLSKIVYVSLRNENDSLVFTHKLKVENATANGDFFIPSSLKTGIYRLIRYTNFSRNNIDEGIALKTIYVLNTFVKNEKTDLAKTDTIVLKNSINTSNEALKSQIRKNFITTDKFSYGYRQKVIAKIKNPFGNADGNCALSIRKMNPVEISNISSENMKSKSSGTFYIPEIRGEIISGKIVAKTGNNPVAGKEVSLTIPGKDYIFKMARTNGNGRFFFSIDEGYSSEKSIIQLNENETNASKYAIVLDKKELTLGNNDSFKIKLDPSLKDWLQERSVQLQIENAYFDVKKDSIFKEKTNAAFFNNLGTVYFLDDYTRFPTVRETFIEVITLAAIRGSGENARFIVNNEYDPNRIAKFNNIDPLVLMDGMQIQDNAELINYNAREIKSIRVINQPYRYGPEIYSGVISVETKKGDFIPALKKQYVEEFDFQPIMKQKQYYSPNYGAKTSLSRIPDYRVQLLWNPNINFKKGDTTIMFYTSDVSGIYEMTLEGYSAEGDYYSAKNYFTVSEN